MRTPQLIKKHTPSNRDQKRVFDVEFQKAMNELLMIECEFYMLLFSDGIANGYNEIYTHCLDKYKIVCSKLNSRPRFVYCNPLYFAEMYAPVENPKS